jgi:CheY-like chemotaxis protein
MAAVRILVADDHDVLRLGVRATLEKNPDWKVVAEARDGQEAVAKARDFEPDVAILDCSVPRLDGLEAARELVRNQPNTKVDPDGAGLDENRIQQGLTEQECSDRLAFQGQDAADGGNQIFACR